MVPFVEWPALFVVWSFYLLNTRRSVERPSYLFNDPLYSLNDPPIYRMTPYLWIASYLLNGLPFCWITLQFIEWPPPFCCWMVTSIRWMTFLLLNDHLFLLMTLLFIEWESFWWMTLLFVEWPLYSLNDSPVSWMTLLSVEWPPYLLINLSICWTTRLFVDWLSYLLNGPPILG